MNGIEGIIFVVCLPPWRFSGWSHRPHDVKQFASCFYFLKFVCGRIKDKWTQSKTEKNFWWRPLTSWIEIIACPKNELLTFNFFFLFPSFPIRFNDYNMFNSLKGFKVPLIFQISLCEKRCVAWDIVFLLFLLDNFLLLFYSMILIIVCNAIALETTTVCLLVEGLSETSAFSFQVTSEKLCFSGSSLCWNSQCLCFTMCN